ncbi:hypothetical protein CLV51_101765 [Chitinophaga niastensis]|uniref:ATP-binding protein n=1 Tax=Chitinophaga niastensis TaxID=536980 RepID=A0A2P8HT86_CHINA|nr:hypothetical protein [Chitinophaga niastensis]PSL49433.1 hypothetical protein CLV51_101765 [Chitinophaga niastensis]
MKKYFPLLALLFFQFTVQAQQTITGLAMPESAVAYKDGYFVSEIGTKLEPLAKDGDGAISFINNAGKLVAFKYFDDTLNSPKGLEIIGNVIYVADIDRLKGYNIDTRKKVFDLNLEGKVTLLNDLSSAGDSFLVVTDSFKDDVLLVNVFTATYTILKGSIPVPNGVLYDAHTDEVYVCSMGNNLDGTGTLFKKKLHDGNAAFELMEGAPVGLFDGIVQLDDNHLLISDWITIKDPTKGNLYVYDIAAKSYRRIEVKRSPADIALDRKNHQLLIPQLLDNRLEVLPLTKIGL